MLRIDCGEQFAFQRSPLVDRKRTVGRTLLRIWQSNGSWGLRCESRQLNETRSWEVSIYHSDRCVSFVDQPNSPILAGRHQQLKRLILERTEKCRTQISAGDSMSRWRSVRWADAKQTSLQDEHSKRLVFRHKQVERNELKSKQFPTRFPCKIRALANGH